VTLLNQTRTDTPCAKTLRIKYFLQLHTRSIAVQITQAYTGVQSTCQRAYSTQ
jgi:hypothetical protein